MPVPPKVKLNPPSEDFKMAVITVGTPEVVCEPCGRTHFCTTYMNDQEAAELKDLALRNPDKYIEHQGDAVQWGMLNGQEVVADCPCHYLTRFETWILNHQSTILSYYANRRDRLRREIQSIDILEEDIRLAGVLKELEKYQVPEKGGSDDG